MSADARDLRDNPHVPMTTRGKWVMSHANAERFDQFLGVAKNRGWTRGTQDSILRSLGILFQVLGPREDIDVVEDDFRTYVHLTTTARCKGCADNYPVGERKAKCRRKVSSTGLCGDPRNPRMWHREFWAMGAYYDWRVRQMVRERGLRAAIGDTTGLNVARNYYVDYLQRSVAAHPKRVRRTVDTAEMRRFLRAVRNPQLNAMMVFAVKTSWRITRSDPASCTFPCTAHPRRQPCRSRLST